jgi:lipopolysaccharide export system protein LptA
MRNSQAQRYARWSAAIALLLVALVTGVYIRRAIKVHEARQKAPPPVPPSVEQRSSEFSFSKVEGDQTVFTVRASRATEFKEGSRNLLEDVSVTIFGRKGERDDTFRTRACDYISSTGKMTCAGEVQITLQPAPPPAGTTAPSDAAIVRVSTSAVSFDHNSGIARTEKPVIFSWPSGEGRAVGAEYDSNSGTLDLVRNIELKLNPPPPSRSQRAAAPQTTPLGSPLELTSDTMTLRREAPAVEMSGQVRARQAARELSADHLVLELDNSLHPRRVVASGHPQLRDAGLSGSLTLGADEIYTALAPEGWAESVTANGNVLGTRTSPAGEDKIEAGRVQVDLAPRQNVPRVLTARDGVVLTSRSATAAGGTQRVQTDALEMRFSNRAKGGRTRLETVNSLAPATAEWQRSVTLGGKATSEITRIRARQINLRFGGSNRLQQLVGSGGVEVARQMGETPEQTTSSQDVTARFSPGGEWATIDQSGDVHFREGVRTAQAERAHLDHGTNSATLTGSVVLADEDSRTTAQSAVFTQGSNQLRAEGGVITTEMRGGSGSIANLATEPAHIAADSLVADTALGRAVYFGHARLWQGASVIEADAIELDKASSSLVARGHVRGVFPQAAFRSREGESGAGSASKGAELWHVKAGQLTYLSAEARATLEGGASADSPQGSLQADRIDLYFSPSETAGSAQQLVRAVATGNVDVRQQGRRGTSERAEYTAAEGKFVLSEGKPTLYDSSGDTTTGRQLTFYFADDRIVVDSGKGSRTVTIHRVEK